MGVEGKTISSDPLMETFRKMTVHQYYVRRQRIALRNVVNGARDLFVYVFVKMCCIALGMHKEKCPGMSSETREGQSKKFDYIF